MASDSTDMDGFIADLLASAPDDAARRSIRRVVDRWAPCRIYLRANHGKTARLAAAVLIEAGVTGAEARRRLALRLSCSLRHAGRLLKAAAMDTQRQAMSLSPLKLPT